MQFSQQRGISLVKQLPRPGALKMYVCISLTYSLVQLRAVNIPGTSGKRICSQPKQLTVIANYPRRRGIEQKLTVSVSKQKGNHPYLLSNLAAQPPRHQRRLVCVCGCVLTLHCYAPPSSLSDKPLRLRVMNSITISVICPPPTLITVSLAM